MSHKVTDRLLPLTRHRHPREQPGLFGVSYLNRSTIGLSAARASSWARSGLIGFPAENHWRRGQASQISTTNRCSASSGTGTARRRHPQQLDVSVDGEGLVATKVTLSLRRYASTLAGSTLVG